MRVHPVVAVVRWLGLGCLLVAFAAPGAGSGPGPQAPRPEGGARALSAKPAALPGGAEKGEAALPPGTDPGWWAKVQGNMRREEYSLSWVDETPLPGGKGAWQAPNRAQGFRTFFTEDGIRVQPRQADKGGWEWGLSLSAWGRPGAVKPLKKAELRAEANRVTLDRPGIREWYLNDERGLEQGFVIAAAPALAPPAATGPFSPIPNSEFRIPNSPLSSNPKSEIRNPKFPLFLDLALTGTLRPVISEDGQAVDFYGDGNFNVLRYAQLKVTDASGRALPARFEGWSGSPFPNSELRTPNSSGGIRIVVDDAGATYPLTVDPLATAPAWTAEGGQDGAEFGYSVATAGDVNGDGYSDVIVGARYYDNGEDAEGRAYVYHGSASGLNTSAAWTAESDQAWAMLGESVATAGDVNGDGYSDVIVGVQRWDNYGTDRGKAVVYHGGSGGLASTPSWTVEGTQPGSYFGNSAATAGDVDGDGFSDVIVGAYEYSNVESYDGAAFVYRGSASGLATTPAWTAEGNQDDSYFGYCVATAGDVNGDGYSDVAVGAYTYDSGETNEGRAFVYYGSSSGLGATPWTAESNQAYAGFGYSVATAGDVNGDGFADLVVGAPFLDDPEAEEGAAFLFLGGASGLQASPAWTAQGNQGNAQFGHSVATAGDTNGDGYADVIVGAHLYDNGEADEGAAFVWFGSSTGLGASGTPLNADWTAEGNQASASFGFSVATAGDVNGDGHSDVLVGANGYANGQASEGAAFLYLGGVISLASPPSWVSWEPHTYYCTGASAGDVNGDGYSDVLVGSSGYTNPEPEEGAAFLYLGSASGLAASPSWTAEGNQMNAWFGHSVASAGDVNGDGYSDVVVGAPLYSPGGVGPMGAVYFYLGAASGLTPWGVYVGSAPNTGVGAGVTGIGDVNGDGYADVMTNSNLGWLVFLGGPSGPSGSPSLYAGITLGFAPAGDVNRDGYSDVVAGNENYSNGQTAEGAAYLYLGGPFGLSASPSWTVESDEAGARLGCSVSTAGDVNGDGYSDILVGALGHNIPDPWSPGDFVLDVGEAFLYLGGPAGPSGAPDWRVEGDWARYGAGLGGSVATAGDVNGDGYSDVVVGAPNCPDINGTPFDPDDDVPDVGQASLFLGGPSGLSASPAWSDEGESEGDGFGLSLASAGDADGDGFADVLVGIASYDDGANSREYAYYGNGGAGPVLKPVQRRADGSAPVAPLGASDATGGFRVGLTARTPFGRGGYKLEWEAKPLGTLFDGTGTGKTAAWQDTGTAGADREDLVTGLSADTPYHWRARLRFNPVTTPFQQAGRWVSIAWNGPQETDLRTNPGAADLGVAQTDSPDPLLLGGNGTYTATVSNAGPEQTRTSLVDTLPAGATFVSATPSQGTCSHASGVVACSLGYVASGGTATVTIVARPAAAGAAVNHVDVSSWATDANPSNDACDETTTVNAPAIGSLVWGDADGDGIQDAGETGLAGVVVKLYDSSYSWLAEKVTNSSGFYQFTGLTYGSSYFVKVFPPSAGYTFSQPDQGGDDTLDSDVDTTTGQTPIFSLMNGLDPTRWDAGLVYGITCDPPDEPVWIYSVTLSVPDDHPILHFQDPNQPGQRTGYHVRRSDDPEPPMSTWPLVATNIVDMDAGTPNIQWTDTSGDVPPSGTWYYQVTAYNAYCPAEGPF